MQKIRDVGHFRLFCTPGMPKRKKDLISQYHSFLQRFKLAKKNSPSLILSTVFCVALLRQTHVIIIIAKHRVKIGKVCTDKCITFCHHQYHIKYESK